MPGFCDIIFSVATALQFQLDDSASPLPNSAFKFHNNNSKCFENPLKIVFLVGYVMYIHLHCKKKPNDIFRLAPWSARGITMIRQGRFLTCVGGDKSCSRNLEIFSTLKRKVASDLAAPSSSSSMLVTLKKK